MEWPSETLLVDYSDFIAESQYHLYNIDPADVPIGFKVWKHPYPPVDKYMNIYGGNVFGLSITEMMIAGVDDETISLLASNNYKKINQYYKEKGIFSIRSRDLKEFFLIPESLEAKLRGEIDYKITQISRVVEDLASEKDSSTIVVGTFTEKEDIVFNVLKSKFYNVKFIRISDANGEKELKFDLIYLASEFKSTVDYIYSLEHKKPRKEQAIKSNAVSFFLSYVYDFLYPGALLYIIADNPVSTPRKNYTVNFNEHNMDERKKLRLFSHIFDTSIEISGNTASLHKADLFNYLRSPHLNKEKVSSLFGITRDWNEMTEEEISRLPKKKMKFPNNNIFLKNVLFCKELYREVEIKDINPEYIRDNITRLFPVETISFKLVSSFLVKKKESYPISKIVNKLTESRLCSSSLDLVAPYKKTFSYLLEVLEIMKEVKCFDFDKNISEMKLAEFPFKIDETEFPINQVMKIQSLIRKSSPYFAPLLELLEKTSQLKKIWRCIGYLDKNINILDNMEKLALSGFTVRQLEEIFLIITGHGPMSRVVFGKYPLRTMESLTNKIQQESLTFKAMENLLGDFTFCSIIEVIAANRRECSLAQWNRFFEILRYGKTVASDLSRKTTWSFLQAREIASCEGTLNTFAQVLSRIFRYNIPDDFIRNAKSKSQEEIMADAEYSEKKFKQLLEVQSLIKLMLTFKERNYPKNDFSRLYFFREALECEIHGAGRSITMLGLCRAFKLIWLAVNTSNCTKINFNTFPVTKESIQKIKEDLDNLNDRDLSILCLEDMKSQLKEGGRAFVYETGFQLKRHNGVVNIYYTNIDNCIRKIRRIISNIMRNHFVQYDTRTLSKLDALFSEISKYEKVYEKEIFRFKQLVGNSERVAAMGRKKEDIHNLSFDLYNIFTKDLFDPIKIYTKLKYLYDYAPGLLSLIFHEFKEFENVKIYRKEYIRTLTDYILKCIKKFQALATSSKEEFQDVEIFNARYLGEFGSASVKGIALQTESVEELENILSSIPYPLQVALGIALTFQDMAKLPSLQRIYRKDIDFVSHAEAGAELLTRASSLGKLNISSYISRMITSLITHHGVMGQILRGEYFFEALFPLLREKNPNFLKAFFIHCVLAVAAFEEGFLTLDLYNEFYALYQKLEDAYKTDDPEDFFAKRYFEEAAYDAWEISKALEEDKNTLPFSGDYPVCDPKNKKEIIKAYGTKGQKILCLRRLLVLIGCQRIEILNVIVAVNNPALSDDYFFKKKGASKNIGKLSYKEQMSKAKILYKEFLTFPHKQREFVVRSLTSVSGNVRFLFLEYLSDFLEPKDQLKLIILSLKVFHYFKARRKPTQRSNYLSFERLFSVIKTRKKHIEIELRKMKYEDIFNDSYIGAFLVEKKNIYFTTFEPTGSLFVDFEDPVSIEAILEKLNKISHLRNLERFFKLELELLENDDNVFRDQVEEFVRAYNSRFEELKIAAVNSLKNRMEKISSAIISGKIPPIQLTKFYDRIIDTNYFKEQYVHLLRDKYEYLSGTLKNTLASNYLEEISHTEHISELEATFDKIRASFKKNQTFLDKSFQDTILKEYGKKKKLLISGSSKNNSDQ